MTQRLHALFLILFAACASASSAGDGVRRWSFDDVREGDLPPGFRVDATRRVGPLATWEVTASEGSGGGKALGLTYPNHKQHDSFNLCWNPSIRFGDGELRVRLCGRSGREDQGGGLIWRAQGPDDYYVVRLNPLENNLRLYTVTSGNRVMLANADVPAVADRWYELSVLHLGDHIECSLDGEVMITFDDAALTEPGGIGLWTKADAATDFDDLEVVMAEG